MLQAVLGTAPPLPSSDVHATLSTVHIKANLSESLPSQLTTAAFTINAADAFDADRARAIFDDFGVLLVRGLNSVHAEAIRHDADAIFQTAIEMAAQGLLSEVVNANNGTAHHVGWVTPDQTLFISAPASHVRDKQVMVLGLDYFTAASMLRAATYEPTIDVVQALLGADSIELFGKGQCFYKEGMPGLTGGNPKFMHQDSAYFMFGRGGAVSFGPIQTCLLPAARPPNRSTHRRIPHTTRVPPPSQGDCSARAGPCLTCRRWQLSATRGAPTSRLTMARCTWCRARTNSVICRTSTRHRTWGCQRRIGPSTMAWS